MLRRRPQPIVSRLVATGFAVAIALAAAATVVPLWPGDQSLSVGDRPPQDLLAVSDAQYESEVLTQQARDRAAEEAEPVLRPIDPKVRDNQIAALMGAMEQVAIVRQRDLTQQARASALATDPEVNLISPPGQAALLELSADQFTAIRSTLNVALADVLSRPIVDLADIPGAIDSYLSARIPGQFDDNESVVLEEVLTAFAAENVEIDTAATEEARSNARANVVPVKISYTEGQVVAVGGEVLNAATIEALRETRVIESGIDFYDIGAGLILAASLGAMLGACLFVFQPLPPSSARPLALVALITILTLAAVRIAVPNFLPDVDGRFYAFAIPVATAAMTAAAFTELQFGAIVAAGVGLFAAFMAATVPDFAGASFGTPLESLELAIAYTAGGLAGAATVYRAERFSRFAVAAVAVAIATGAVLLAFWLLDTSRTNEQLGWIALMAAAAGAGAAVLTVGILVLLSHALGVTTRLQLLELAQANSPLLRRLQDEAPGTYHHSMLVGALAERAAEQIGADPLVTRAGAYYHDIGKLAQPEFYIENIFPGATSPHDALEPEESARRIIDHVSNGLDLARKNRLPAIIRDFIPEHHGSRLVVFFYRKARSNGLEPDPARYRYAGPRPRSKESAIVMLADSCEAVVRAGIQRDADEIGKAVDSVFAERLAEGQLDECDITMREVNAVADSFKSTLRAVYHQRIEYPPAEEESAIGDGREQVVVTATTN